MEREKRERVIKGHEDKTERPRERISELEMMTHIFKVFEGLACSWRCFILPFW